MSTHVQSWVFQYSRSELADRLVLLAIADEAHDDGVGWPGQDRIAHKARVHRGTAYRCLQRLEASGELLVRRPSRQGRGHHNVYCVVMGRDPDLLREAIGWPPASPEKGRVPQTFPDVDDAGEEELPTVAAGAIPGPSQDLPQAVENEEEGMQDAYLPDEESARKARAGGPFGHERRAPERALPIDPLDPSPRGPLSTGDGPDPGEPDGDGDGDGKEVLLGIAGLLGEAERDALFASGRGGRVALEQRLAELVAGGWDRLELVNELGGSLPANLRTVVAVLLARARALPGVPPRLRTTAPPSPVDEAALRRRRVIQAEAFGTTMRSVEGLDPDDVADQLERAYAGDPELLALARRAAGLEVDEPP